MSDVIRVLESMGRGAPVFTAHDDDGRHLPPINDLELSGAEWKALVERDIGALEALVGGRRKMMMQIWAPEEDVPQEGEQTEEGAPGEEQEDTPERDT